MTYLTEEQKQGFINDGYVVARNLLPADLVTQTRQSIFAATGLREGDSSTWRGALLPEAAPLTESCRTREVEEIARELVGANFSPGASYSPVLELRGENPIRRGFVPVMTYPQKGRREFSGGNGFHIDGMHLVTTWPDKNFLVVFAYLSDVAEYGGATTILPGSHRQVFEHWLQTGDKGNTHPPELDYAAPIPLPGHAGDVIFMHYLAAHSGSNNYDNHIRVGLNTAVMPDPNHPYQPKTGAPQPDWTPLDWTLRTDNLTL